MQRTILITGGAGFIGSHVVRLFVTKYPDYRIVNLDKLTYAGNLANLRDIEERPNYTFVRGDICDFEAMRELFRQYGIDGVIHLAAESHVDRSIKDPFTFARTNVMGTLSLLEAARGIGGRLSQNDAARLTRALVSAELLTQREGQLLLSACSDGALAEVEKSDRDRLRAAIYRCSVMGIATV